MFSMLKAVGIKGRPCRAVVRIPSARLGWLDGQALDVPISVATETIVGGDDLRLVLQDNAGVDVQVKKGPQAGPYRLYREAHHCSPGEGFGPGLARRDELACPPSEILECRGRWTAQTNTEFTILGVVRPISVDVAFIPVTPSLPDDGADARRARSRDEPGGQQRGTRSSI